MTSIKEYLVNTAGFLEIHSSNLDHKSELVGTAQNSTVFITMFLTCKKIKERSSVKL